MRPVTIIAATCAAIASTNAFAQVGVYDEGRAVLAINPSSAYHDIRHQTDWQFGPAAQYNLNITTNGDGGATASETLYDYANYGTLTAGSTASCTNSNQTGVFVIGSQYIGGDYNAAFRDTITANQDMDVLFDFKAAASISTFDIASADVVNFIEVGGNSYNTTLSATTTNDQQVQLHLAAGQTVNFLDALQINCSAGANQLNPIITSSYSLDSSAGLSIKVLTQGATYKSGSGTIYAAPETPTGLLTGSLVLLLALFRPRKSA